MRKHHKRDVFIAVMVACTALGFFAQPSSLWSAVLAAIILVMFCAILLT